MSTAVQLASPEIPTPLATAPDYRVVRVLTAVRRELPFVASLDEAKARVDAAAAVQTLLRRRNRSRATQNAAALLSVVAEHRAGELLKENPPRRGRPPKSLHRETLSSAIAITAVESHRWRKLADNISVPDLEAMETEATATGREFTRAYIWRNVRSMLGKDEDVRQWERWAERLEQKATHDALNKLYAWLAPFQPPGRSGAETITNADEAIAGIVADAGYLTAHDRALLSEQARRAVEVVTKLLEIVA